MTLQEAVRAIAVCTSGVTARRDTVTPLALHAGVLVYANRPSEAYLLTVSDVLNDDWIVDYD